MDDRLKHPLFRRAGHAKAGASYGASRTHDPVRGADYSDKVEDLAFYAQVP